MIALLVSLVAHLAAGPAPAPLPFPGSARPACGEAASLERALAAVRTEDLRADLAFLADPALAGRDTPSPGLRVAALYLAAELERLGFEGSRGPGGGAGEGDGRPYLVPWTLRESGLDAAASSLTLVTRRGERRLAFGTDYFLARTTHVVPLVLEGDVVSAGAGTRDEFEAADLEGAWALVLDRGASIRRVQRHAAERGALGVLLAETEELEQSYRGRYERTAEAQSRVILSLDGPPAAVALDAEEAPLVLLGATAVEELAGAAGDVWGEREVGPPAGTRLPLRVAEERALHAGAVEVANVAGLWPGRDPRLAREVLVVTAHYDHVGVSGGEVHPGADDNASGCAGLLAVARALEAYGPLRRSVLLLWTSGEEKGLWGSAAWTRDPVLPEGWTVAAAINLDMIGRTGPEELYVTPTREHEAFGALSEAVHALAPLEGFPALRSQDRDWRRSDHVSFHENLGVPVVFLSAGEHPDYHRPTDTADRIDHGKATRVARLVVRLLDRVEEGPLR